MALLISPTLTTPLLKIPLLLASTVYSYRGWTPPTPVADAKEQQRFSIPDWLSRNNRTQLPVSYVLKGALAGVVIAEIVALLAQAVGPSPLSDRVLAFLFPYADTHPTSLRLSLPAVAGCLLSISGGLIRIWCHRTLGRFFTWQVSLRADHELITSGPYSVVRHPSYTGWALMVIGNTLLVWSPGSYFVESGLAGVPSWRAAACVHTLYCAAITAMLLSRAPKEDAVMKKEFGAKWEAWAEKTPYKLVPFIY